MRSARPDAGVDGAVGRNRGGDEYPYGCGALPLVAMLGGVRRLLLRGLTVLGVLALVVGGAVAGVGVARSRAADRTEDEARSTLLRRLPASRDAAAGERDAALSAQSGPGPAYSWESLTCTADHQDAGLLVQTWTYRCHVDAQALLPRRGRPGACLVAGAGDHGPAAADCAAHLSLPGGYAPVQVLDGTPPPSLRADHAWLVVAATREVVDLDLGCAPLALLTCDWPGRGRDSRLR